MCYLCWQRMEARQERSLISASRAQKSKEARTRLYIKRMCYVEVCELAHNKEWCRAAVRRMEVGIFI